jgi:carboxypeptidase T
VKKNLLFLAIILMLIPLLYANSFAQKNISSEQEKYSQVRIFTTSEIQIQQMLNAGLIIDHASTKHGQYMDTWLSEYEMNLLKKSGVSYQLLVDDWMDYYNKQPKMTDAEIDAAVQQTKEKFGISHSIFGSMGGYMTYAEVVSKLDSMRMWYPQFISAKFSAGNTFENRDMWVVRVTHNPDAPTGRPQVLMHALIHAREPESMETQFFYMFWLFENYNTNLTARYILDNREIYWMPVLNADGYVYNQTTNPNGGGMWRCNRHVTSGNCGYTDINRNFGLYAYWNSSNGGSSTDPCSGGQGTYRGPSPFSEIETQNMMNFVNTHNFNSSISAHTYGNYFIKTWCWQDPIPTPDDAKYNLWFSNMDYSSPQYTYGFPSQTVGYQVRGGTDDWYYNDSAHAGHHIFSYTPETDATTFWPPQSFIIPEAEAMLYNNQYWTLIAGPFVDYLSSNFNQASYTTGSSGTFKVRFQNKGALVANNTHIILTPANANVTIPTQQYNFNTAVFAVDSATFNFTVAAGAQNNCYLPTILTIKQDTTTVYSVGIFIPVGTPTVAATLLNDNGSTFSNWTAGGTSATWNTTTTQYNSAPSSFSESPAGSYGNGVDLTMTLTNPINTLVYPAVFLSFYHRYATEANFDYCMVEVSSNNGNTWQPVAEYQGTLSTWTQQTFDISRYANRSPQMKVRFRLVADAGSVADGWYVDDVVITAYNVGGITGVENNNNVPGRFSLEQNYPNPFNPVTQINYSLAKDEFVKIKVFDILGREVAVLVNKNQKAGKYSVDFDGTSFASGLYMYKIESGNFTDVKKMTLIK